MSVCTFIASNCPLAEVAPEKEFDNFFLLPFLPLFLGGIKKGANLFLN